MEIEKALGPEAKLDIKVGGGKVVLSVVYAGAGGGADVSVSLESGYFIDKLAAAIPGSIDDAILAILKAALAA
jgi:hypothetical protein